MNVTHSIDKHWETKDQTNWPVPPGPLSSLPPHGAPAFGELRHPTEVEVKTAEIRVNKMTPIS